MSILDTIKSLFGGSELKVSGLIGTIIEKVKPLIEQGKIGDAVKNAIGDYGDLGEKLSAIIGKLKGASGDAKTSLITEKSGIVAAIKEKGGALLSALNKENALPDEIKSIIAKVEALIKKL